MLADPLIDRLQLLRILLEFRAHPHIPESEVKRVVPVHMGVVHVVVRGGGLPLQQPVAAPALRNDFIAQVSDHIHDQRQHLIGN